MMRADPLQRSLRPRDARVSKGRWTLTGREAPT